MKRAAVVILILAAAFAGGYFLGRRKASPDPAYWVDRAAYDAAVTEAAAKLEDAAAVISQAQGTIAEQTIEIEELTADALAPSPAEVAKDAEISKLEARIATYEGQGDLAGALAASKADNTAWAEKFNLAAERHLDSLSALNNAWQVKFDAQVAISNEWKEAFEREHALRLACDGLRIRLEAAGPSSRFERAACDVEGVSIGIYSAIKHKDPIPLATYVARKFAVKAWKIITGGK